MPDLTFTHNFGWITNILWFLFYFGKFKYFKVDYSTMHDCIIMKIFFIWSTTLYNKEKLLLFFFCKENNFILFLLLFISSSSSIFFCWSEEKVMMGCGMFLLEIIISFNAQHVRVRTDNRYWCNCVYLKKFEKKNEWEKILACSIRIISFVGNIFCSFYKTKRFLVHVAHRIDLIKMINCLFYACGYFWNIVSCLIN